MPETLEISYNFIQSSARSLAYKNFTVDRCIAADLAILRRIVVASMGCD
jgi:hypothetical protein